MDNRLHSALFDDNNECGAGIADFADIVDTSEDKKVRVMCSLSLAQVIVCVSPQLGVQLSSPDNYPLRSSSLQ